MQQIHLRGRKLPWKPNGTPNGTVMRATSFQEAASRTNKKDCPSVPITMLSTTPSSSAVLPGLGTMTGSAGIVPVSCQSCAAPLATSNLASALPTEQGGLPATL